MFHISDLLGLIPQRELQSYDRYRNKHGERSLARCSLRNDVTDFCTLTCWCLQWVIRISASAVNVCNHIYPYIHCQHCTKHKLSKKYHRFPCFFFVFFPPWAAAWRALPESLFYPAGIEGQHTFVCGRGCTSLRSIPRLSYKLWFVLWDRN